MVIPIDIKEYLLDWIIKFLENKDLITNNITEVQKHKDSFDAVVFYKDKTQQILVEPTLQDINTWASKVNDNFLLVITLNSRENLKFLIGNWNEFVKHKKLCLYFVNPFSAVEKKWIIFPYTHHRISDDASLKRGLQAMFETVEEISEQEVKSKI